MVIELTTLPLEIQEQIQRIKQGEQIIITDQGKVMTCATVDTQPSYANGDFEFDLERMKQAIGETDENGRAKHATTIPKGLAKDFDAFHQWMLARSSCK